VYDYAPGERVETLVLGEWRKAIVSDPPTQGTDRYTYVVCLVTDTGWSCAKYPQNVRPLCRIRVEGNTLILEE